MGETRLPQMALGLTPSWTVTDADFDPDARRLDIHIDFPSGDRFTRTQCGAAGCPAQDTAPMTWRHLNFFRHQAYPNARGTSVPRERSDIGTTAFAGMARGPISPPC